VILLAAKQEILARINAGKARRLEIERRQRAIERDRYAMYVRSCKHGPFGFDYDYSNNDDQGSDFLE
jgi:hypothetical protein